MDNLNGKILKEALTYDDVLLVPGYSCVLPKDVCIKTKLTNHIELNIPLISAAMDTVTEDKMAICIAREGGIGIIHKNLPIEKQAYYVSKVKRMESGVISKPFTVNPEDTIKKVLEYSNLFDISGFPVVDQDYKLVGIITHRDIKYVVDTNTLVSEVMTSKDLVVASHNITIEEAKEILIKNRVEKLPIIDKDNKLVGLVNLRDIDNVINYPNACKDNIGRLRVGAAVSTTADVMKRVEALVSAEVDVIVCDSAHGHSKSVIDTIKAIRDKYPDLDIIGGNVCTKEACIDLIKAGCNAIKVGVGPGSICTTRVVAGIGVPQITAVIDCYEVCKEYNIPVIADGGIKVSGDITKALAAGADTVMLGGMLAGCDEAPGEEIIFDGRKYKVYVGMGSIAAMSRGSGDRYFQSEIKEAKKLVPEGIEGRVPYRGSVKDVIYQLLGGLRSGMGYCGCSKISILKENAKFVRITGAGLKESHPHDVDLIKESPNYSRK